MLDNFVHSRTYEQFVKAQKSGSVKKFNAGRFNPSNRIKMGPKMTLCPLTSRSETKTP
jgi:hypothetical protein